MVVSKNSPTRLIFSRSRKAPDTYEDAYDTRDQEVRNGACKNSPDEMHDAISPRLPSRHVKTRTASTVITPKNMKYQI